MEIDFDKMQGLAPAVIQDAKNGEMLMLGFMNREALDMTLRTGFVTFYSRTRQKLWTKGESSGNRLQVVAASTDCDRDTVLLRVHVLGEGKQGLMLVPTTIRAQQHYGTFAERLADYP